MSPVKASSPSMMSPGDPADTAKKTLEKDGANKHVSDKEEKYLYREMSMAENSGCDLEKENTKQVGNKKSKVCYFGEGKAVTLCKPCGEREKIGVLIKNGSVVAELAFAAIFELQPCLSNGDDVPGESIKEEQQKAISLQQLRRRLQKLGVLSKNGSVVDELVLAAICKLLNRDALDSQVKSAVRGSSGSVLKDQANKCTDAIRFSGTINFQESGKKAGELGGQTARAVDKSKKRDSQETGELRNSSGKSISCSLALQSLSAISNYVQYINALQQTVETEEGMYSGHPNVLSRDYLDSSDISITSHELSAHIPVHFRGLIQPTGKRKEDEGLELFENNFPGKSDERGLLKRNMEDSEPRVPLDLSEKQHFFDIGKIIHQDFRKDFRGKLVERQGINAGRRPRISLRWNGLDPKLQAGEVPVNSLAHDAGRDEEGMEWGSQAASGDENRAEEISSSYDEDTVSGEEASQSEALRVGGEQSGDQTAAKQHLPVFRELPDDASRGTVRELPDDASRGTAQLVGSGDLATDGAEECAVSASGSCPSQDGGNVASPVERSDLPNPPPVSSRGVQDSADLASLVEVDAVSSACAAQSTGRVIVSSLPPSPQSLSGCEVCSGHSSNDRQPGARDMTGPHTGGSVIAHPEDESGPSLSEEQWWSQSQLGAVGFTPNSQTLSSQAALETDSCQTTGPSFRGTTSTTLTSLPVSPSQPDEESDGAMYSLCPSASRQDHCQGHETSHENVVPPCYVPVQQCHHHQPQRTGVSNSGSVPCSQSTAGACSRDSCSVPCSQSTAGACSWDSGSVPCSQSAAGTCTCSRDLASTGDYSQSAACTPSTADHLPAGEVHEDGSVPAEEPPTPMIDLSQAASIHHARLSRRRDTFGDDWPQTSSTDLDDLTLAGFYREGQFHFV